MYTVVVHSTFNPTRSDNSTQSWYTYGPFKTWASASRWAVRNVSHISDDNWHIAQHIPQDSEQS